MCKEIYAPQKTHDPKNFRDDINNPFLCTYFKLLQNVEFMESFTIHLTKLA